MIRIRTIDEANIQDVCLLHDGKEKDPSCIDCAAFYIACSKCNPALYVNAIYSRNVLIGFFAYERTGTRSDEVMFRHISISREYRNSELLHEVFEHILRGFRLQGASAVVFSGEQPDELAMSIFSSFGFRLAKPSCESAIRYELAL